MKVLFVSNDPAIFNPASDVHARMNRYAEAFGELHIVCPADRREEFHAGALHLYPVSSLRILRLRSLEKRTRALISEKAIEIVSAQDPFEQGLAALRATRGTSAKLHIQVHTDFLSPWFIRAGNWRSPVVRMPFLNRYRLRWADEVLPKADGIRVVSERVKESLIKRYGSRIKEPSVIAIAIDSTVPEPVSLPPHPFTFVLLAVGRLEPEKRIEDILAALKLVHAHYPMVGLIVAGEGRERHKLERMASKLGLENNVIFLGNRPDARGLMRSAHAFIQASAYEGYGRTLLEAALAKVPIITTDVGIVGEVFKGYEHVLSAPVADPTALSLNIVGILEDTAVRLELPIHAEEAAQAHIASQGDTVARVADDLARIVGTQSHAS